MDEEKKMKRGKVKTIAVPPWLYEEIRELKHELKVESMYEAIAKVVEEYREMHEIKHLNTYKDHIKLLHNNRVIDVYIKLREGRNGRRLDLYCDYDKSDDCVHIRYCWWNEKIRKALLEILEKGYTDPVPGDV